MRSALKHQIGILLLISAGTFLYVATMHILPSKSHHHDHGLEESDEDSKNDGEKINKEEHKESSFQTYLNLSVLILGLYTPYFIKSLH